MGIKNHCYANNAFLTTVQNLLSGYTGEHYTTIATRPHDPNHGSHLNKSWRTLIPILGSPPIMMELCLSCIKCSKDYMNLPLSLVLD